MANEFQFIHCNNNTFLVIHFLSGVHTNVVTLGGVTFKGYCDDHYNNSNFSSIIYTSDININFGYICDMWLFDIHTDGNHNRYYSYNQSYLNFIVNSLNRIKSYETVCDIIGGKNYREYNDVCGLTYRMLLNLK